MTISIKTHPNAKQDKFAYQNDILEVWIKAPATEDKANKYLINYLSQILDIPKSLISIRKGSQSKFKLIEINIATEIINLRLQQIN
jgi:uncharacterized protein (TIGR00251 family)